MLRYSTCACWVAWVPALSVSACDRPAPEPRPVEPQAVGVTIRDSAGIEIVENHTPVWSDGDFWTVDPEPKFVLGGLWNVFRVVPLSDGRVVMLTPDEETKVAVFEPSWRLSA